MGRIIERSNTLVQARNQTKDFDSLLSIIQDAIDTITRNQDFRKPIRSLRKQAQEFMEYQHIETMVDRDLRKDRIFPLETVAIQEFERTHELPLHRPIIHTGPAADELSRAMNAFAVTIAGDIYFRNNAWNPSSEEGKKILAHELTHVSQYEQKRILPSTKTEDLEHEAEQAEQKETYETDPLITVPVGGQTYRIPKSRIPRLKKMIAENTEEWLENQKHTMDESEYLELLLCYRQWLKEAM